MAHAGYAGGGALRKALDLAQDIVSHTPEKTVSAYKLFRQKNDDLYPLFVNANKPVPVDEWLPAESGPLVGGKVKSSLGPLAYRPGWHAGDLPIATHIGGKSQPGLKAPDYRPDNQVWAEIMMPDDVDWQTEALARAQRSKAGDIIPRTAHITDQIPVGGFYRYKTNPNMTGNWLIGGSMKVNRVLSDDEVRAINDAAGVSDLPRLHELMQRGNYASGGEVGGMIQDRYPSHYMPGVGRQVMADGGAASYSAPITGAHTITLDDLIGRAPPPSGPQPRAYTDAGGQKIAAPFVTSMMGGYPVAPMSGSTASSSTDSISDLFPGLRTIRERLGFAEGGSPDPWRDIERARQVADDVAMSHPVGMSGAVEFAPVRLREPLSGYEMPLGSVPQETAAVANPLLDMAVQGVPWLAGPEVGGAYDFAVGMKEGDMASAMMGATGLPGRAAKAAGILGSTLASGDAEADTPVGAALKLARKFGRSTVAHPYRKAFPGIYGDPREIVAEAESRVAPESPALKQLFGVTRQDLYDIGATRPGNMEPQIAMKPGARGTPSAENLMVPRNERRLMDVLDEAGKQPGLRTGMDPWYVMDPLYERMEQLLGPEEAKRKYDVLNHSIGTMSPGSPVTTEVNRGLAAYYLHNNGRYKDFLDFGGNPGAATRILPDHNRSFAEEFPDLLGHAYHSTSQAPILQKYLETGDHGMQSPKVPLYIQSSGVPATGFQTKLPVPDAHFTRAVGMADTRKGENDFGVSMKMPEYQQTGPWFRDKVAAPLGMEAVSAQARLWGAMSGQTGVDTAIGSPKLEMIANEIMRISKKYGISPERARDMVLQGELFNRGGSVINRALDVVSEVMPKTKAA